MDASRPDLIPLQPEPDHLYIAVIPRDAVADPASLVLAVRADVAPETVWIGFAASVTIDTVRDIDAFGINPYNREIIGLRLLELVPPQLLAEPGTVYFEFDELVEPGVRQAVVLKACLEDGGMAIYVGGDWPNLAMELHAIAKASLLSAPGSRRPVRMPFTARRYGIQVGPLGDRPVSEETSFVLAVRAGQAAGVVRATFPARARIGPVEDIVRLVDKALPGIGLLALSKEPHWLPADPGAVYFEFDRTSEIFRGLNGSSGIAIQVGDDWPDLSMELWAFG